MGHSLTVLADVHPNVLVTQFFNNRRKSKGLSVVPVTEFHRCLRALKTGSMVAIVGDRPVTGHGVSAQFFGRPTLVPDGYAVLARRFGAVIVPSFLLRTDSGLYDFVLDEPIVPRVTEDEEADVRECVERCLRVVERYVTAHPEQWYVFRPIWEEQSALRDRRAARGRRALGTAAPRPTAAGGAK